CSRPPPPDFSALSLHDALPICATALRMAEEGCAVAVTDVLESQGAVFADELTARGLKARFWRLDVSREADVARVMDEVAAHFGRDRKSTRLNSSHVKISYAVFC